ncbi:MAG: hypothetical protein JRN15_23270, partial [Nitrososphaerota archaeon]|nr:hypothetical protein [Nitrososphaerota archaeon]
LPNWLSVVRMNPRGDSALAKTLLWFLSHATLQVSPQKEPNWFAFEIHAGSNRKDNNKFRS